MSKDKIRTTKPLMILLYGFPGAGKTYFARNLAENVEIAHVHSDRIRHELFEEPRFDEQENSIVTHLMNYMSEEFLNSGVSVIYDTNMMRKSQRLNMREFARKKGVKTLLIWFQVDADTAFRRLKSRDRRTSDDKFAMDYTQTDFRKYAARMQHPEPTEDFVVVSGKHTFNTQKSALFKRFMDMGIISSETVQKKVVKPGLINLVPRRITGRVDMSRRNIKVQQ